MQVTPPPSLNSGRRLGKLLQGWGSPKNVCLKAYCAVGLGVLLTWLAMWWPVVSGRMQLFMRDLTFYALPMKTVMMERLRAGELPFWTPYLSGGMPFLAEMSNQVLYPLNAVFWLTPTLVHGLSWFILMHHLLGMAMVVWLARVCGVRSWWVAGWCGVIYGLSGYVISVTDNVNYFPVVAWAPMVMVGWIQGLKRHQWRTTLLSTLGLAMMVLAGDTFNPLFMGVVAVLLLVAKALSAKDRSTKDANALFAGTSWWQAMLHLGGSMVLAMGLCAPQLLPTWELQQMSVRGQPLTYDEVTLWSFPPARLIELIQPFFYGSKFPSPHFFGMFLYPQFREPWADSVYVGLIPLLLVGCALWRRVPLARFWLAVGVIALLISFGRYGFYFSTLYQLIGPLQVQRYLEKLVYWPTLSLVMMAGLGLQALPQMLDWLKQKFAAKVWWVPVVWLVGAAVGLSIVLLKIPCDLWIWPHAMESSMDWQGRFFFREPHVAYLWVHWGMVLVPVLAALATLRLVDRPPHRFIALCLSLVVLGDLAVLHGRHTGVAPTSLLTHQALPKVMATLGPLVNQQHQPIGRILYDDNIETLDKPNDPAIQAQIRDAYGRPSVRDTFEDYWIYRVLYNQQRLLFNHGMTHDLAYLNGRFAPLQPLHHKQLDVVMQRYAPQRYTRLMGVNVIVTAITPENDDWGDPKPRPRPLPDPRLVPERGAPPESLEKASAKAFQEVYRDPTYNVRVLAVKQVLPGAHWIIRPLYNQDPGRFPTVMPTFNEQLGQGEITLGQRAQAFAVLLPGTKANHREPVMVPPQWDQWSQQHPESIALTVTGTLPMAWLVIQQSYFPGWKAWIDGLETPVSMANHRWLAVPVPQGQHVVRLTYESNQWLLGVALGCVSLILALALGVLDCRPGWVRDLWVRLK
jgi:hypothetical protein